VENNKNLVSAVRKIKEHWFFMSARVKKQTCDPAHLNVPYWNIFITIARKYHCLITLT